MCSTLFGRFLCLHGTTITNNVKLDRNAMRWPFFEIIVSSIAVAVTSVSLEITHRESHRVRTGHEKPRKSWNLRISFSKSWKVMECNYRSFKVTENKIFVW